MEQQNVQWNELTSGKPFITDLGDSIQNLNGVNETIKGEIGRYAAFMPVPGQKRHQIVEISKDLEFLILKYGVSRELVFVVGYNPPTESN